jgi:hypothetical protein
VASLDGGCKNLQNIISSSIYIITKHSENPLLKPHIKHFLLLNGAIAALRLRLYKEGRELLWQAFIQQPWKIKTLIRLIVSLFSPISDKVWKPYV